MVKKKITFNIQMSSTTQLMQTISIITHTHTHTSVALLVSLFMVAPVFLKGAKCF